jgi:LysW-gamma-L-lysine carboxypeptidase
MDEVGFLRDLVAIRSPSGHEDEVGEFLVRSMTELGFRAHRDEAGNAVGEIGDPAAERVIVMLGHMDTVPGEVPIRREGTLLYGRGSVDAKGPLATFVLATSRVAAALGNVRVRVIGAVEEESFGRGAKHVAATMQPPECVVIGEPSHWEGITLGYKGRLCVEYHLSQPGSHSASEAQGPAEKAIAFWNRLMTHAEEENGGQSGRFSTLDPALNEFRTYSDGLDDEVQMGIVIRIPPGVDADVLRASMESWAGGAELRFSPVDRPFRAEKNTPIVRALLRAIRAEGGRPRFKLKTGTSDMNVVGPAWGCPAVAYGPGDSALDHTPNEHIDVREYRRAINVLARALRILGE